MSYEADLQSERGGLAVMLRLSGRRCVVVGGGATGRRRAEALREAGAEVVLIDPAGGEDAETPGLERWRRGYEPGDLAGAFLVVIATDDAAVNERVAGEASSRGVLINRADEPGSGDVTVMAQRRLGPLTVAVDSGQSSASAAGAIRDEAVAGVDAVWPGLLAEARPWRAKIQASTSDPGERRAKLRRLTDASARRILKDHGAAALRRHFAEIAGAGPDCA